MPPSTRGYNSAHARNIQRQQSRCSSFGSRASARHVCWAESSNGSSPADPLLLRAARGEGMHQQCSHNAQYAYSSIAAHVVVVVSVLDGVTHMPNGTLMIQVALAKHAHHHF